MGGGDWWSAFFSSDRPAAAIPQQASLTLVGVDHVLHLVHARRPLHLGAQLRAGWGGVSHSWNYWACLAAKIGIEICLTATDTLQAAHPATQSNPSRPQPPPALPSTCASLRGPALRASFSAATYSFSLVGAAWAAGATLAGAVAGALSCSALAFLAG